MIDLPLCGDAFAWVGDWCFFNCFDGFVVMFSGVCRFIVINEPFLVRLRCLLLIVGFLLG